MIARQIDSRVTACSPRIVTLFTIDRGQRTFKLFFMARPWRIEYPGALSHVMARGHQGRSIIAEDPDRTRFLATLGQACQKTLKMGHYTRVSQAVSRMRGKPTRKPIQLQQRVQQAAGKAP